MATADDYASWIVKNADKKGTPDFDVVARAYSDAMAGGVPTQSKAAADNAAWEAKVKGDLTGDMSGIGKFVAGYGKAVPDMVRGIGQRLGQGVDAVFAPQKNLNDLITGGAGKTMSSRMGLPQQSDIDEAKRLDAPLMATGAGTVGNVFGNIGTGVGAGAAIAATLPASVGAMGTAALTGGALGAAQPTATGDSNKLLGVNVGNAALANTLEGAGLGAASVAAGQVIGAGYRGLKAIAEPFTAAGPQRIAGRTILRFAEDPSKIANVTNKATVTGAQPTLAEQTGDGGLARLQDSLRSIDPQLENALATRARTNNASRVNALRTMAGQDGARDFAVAERAGTAENLYGEAFKNPPKQALATVETEMASPILNAQGKPFTTTQTSTVPKNASQIGDLLQTPAIADARKSAVIIAKNKGIDLNDPAGSVQGLHYMKLAMDDAISAAKNKGTAAGDNLAGSIKDAQTRLVSFLDNASPDYAAARKVYADMSKPVNQMDIAAQVAKKGLSKGSDLSGTQTINRDALLGSMSNESTLIRQATGRTGAGNRLADVMEPEQLNMLNTIRSEVDRVGAVATAGNGPGSATAQRLASQNILRQTISPNGAGGNSLAQKAGSAIVENTLANTLVGKATNWLYSGIAEPKIQQALLKSVLQPEEAQAAIAAAQKQGVKLPNNLLTQLVNQARRVTGISSANATRQP